MFKNSFRILISVFCLIYISSPLRVLAHQPRIVETENINVIKPEISKAYYGKLSENPHIYNIKAKSTINLYVNILVPFLEGPEKKFIIKVLKDNQSLANLSPGKEDWKQFFEPFGQSTYWQGPEYKIRAEAGNYKIIVQSAERNVRYVLAIGEIEAFDGVESLNAILLIPELKRNFFKESPINFIYSPLGWGYILILQILALLIGKILSKLLEFSEIKIQKGYFNRFPRSTMILGVIIWASLLGWAITTSWNPILIILSGLALFITITSWYCNNKINEK